MSATIIYHDNCHDGITALWAARQKLPDAEAYAGKYDEPPDLDRLQGRDLVFVDFCFKREVMIKLRKCSRSILVLDHHKTAMQDMLSGGESLIDLTKWSGPLTWEQHKTNVQQDYFKNVHSSIYMLFDMERSGAGLAWDMLVGGLRPKLIDYVEDRDLWRFALLNSREVHAACGSYPLDLITRSDLMTRGIDLLASEGRAILRYHDKLVWSAAKHALTERIGGIDVPSIACPTIEIISDLGHMLAQGRPFAATWVERPDGKRQYSLRSTEGGVDVSEIAKLYGGGGHKNAAGFVR